MSKKEMYSEIEFDLYKLERFRYNIELDYRFKKACDKKYEDLSEYGQYNFLNMSENDRKEYYKKIKSLHDYDKLQEKVK